MGMSLKDYNNMTYRDFVLKMDGFKQKQDYEENLIRTVAFITYRAPHLNPKNLAKNIDKFWPMDKKGDSKKVSDEKRAAIKKALQEEQKLKAKDNVS